MVGLEHWTDREFVGHDFTDEDPLTCGPSVVFTECDFTSADLSRSTHLGSAFRNCRFRRTTLCGTAHSDTARSWDRYSRIAACGPSCARRSTSVSRCWRGRSARRRSVAVPVRRDPLVGTDLRNAIRRNAELSTTGPRALRLRRPTCAAPVSIPRSGPPPPAGAPGSTSARRWPRRRPRSRRQRRVTLRTMS